MVELTQREKIIISALSYFLHDALKNFPLDHKIQFVKTILGVRNINVSLDELKDIITAINQEQNDAIKFLFKKMNG